MSYQEGEAISHEIARPHSPLIDGITATALALVGGAMAFFVIPSASFPFQFTKIAFIGFAALAGLAAYIVGRMQERRIRFPRSLLFYAVWLLPLAYLISGIFSSNVQLSLVGAEGISSDSALFMAFLAILFAVVISLARSKDKILQYYLAILGGGIFLALIQFIRLFADGFTLGVLTTKTSSLIGSWNALSLFFGLVIVLSLITLLAVRVEGILKIIIAAAITLSLVFVGIIDYNLTWWLVGIAALGVFVYSISFGNHGRGSRMVSGMSFSSLIVLAFAIIFVVGGTNLQTAISNGLNLQYVEVRPSWQTTVDIARQSLGTNFIFGSGPGTFGKEWLLHKPNGVNQTNFWNVDFASGIGFIPSTLATMGLVGIFAWLIFFGVFLWTGFKTLLRGGSEDAIGYYLSLSSFVGALYLWVAEIFYTPGPVMLALAFLFTALFVASLRLRDSSMEKVISFVETPKLGFLAVLFLTIAFLGSIAGIFSVAETYAASAYYQHAIATLNTTGDLTAGETSAMRAISFNKSAEYYRLVAAINIAKINQLATAQNVTPDDIRTRFQAALGSAVAAAQAATVADPNDYQNWLALAQVYQSVVPLKIQGAYENAIQSYDKAIALNPHAPSLYLAQAQLAVVNGNMAEGEKYVTKAIQEKNNYTDAIFLLSQIQINEGKIDEASQAVAAATVIDPSNPVAYFQLGVLRYSKKDYPTTIAALEQAVALSSNYSNARYFLGLAYAATGRKDDAIAQFVEIEKLNPDNQEVKTVLENLRAGKEPFSPIAATKVQNLKGLPVPDTKPPADTTE